MARPEDVAQGIMIFAEAELLPALDGWRMWAAGAVLALANQRASSILDNLSKNKAIAALGVVAEDGGIDVETVAAALRQSARKHGKIKIEIPLLDVEYTFAEKDIDTLLGYIETASGEE